MQKHLAQVRKLVWGCIGLIGHDIEYLPLSDVECILLKLLEAYE